MANKLPTTFQVLDLTGFDIDQKVVPSTGINREMVDTACAVLQKNHIAIIVRSLRTALKHIYGIGGSTDQVCTLLGEWRTDNLASLKEGKNENGKGLMSVLAEAVDDGVVGEEEIPADYLQAARQMAIATYRLAYQQADTSIAGDRIKQLTSENDVMSRQLKDFPRLEMELSFYKSEYERQRDELRDAYLNLDKQRLTNSEEFQKRLETLSQERNDLALELNAERDRLAKLEGLEQREHERNNEIARLQGQLEARERVESQLREQVQSLQSVVGEKQVLEKQISELQSQLAAAQTTITALQAKRVANEIQVDADLEEIIAEKEALKAELETLRKNKVGTGTGTGKVVPIQKQA